MIFAGWAMWCFLGKVEAATTENNNNNSAPCKCFSSLGHSVDNDDVQYPVTIKEALEAPQQSPFIPSHPHQSPKACP